MSEQTKNLLGGNYNPDVLECLANLSNDEVFTPPKVVNNMLDMLPEETWSNPNLKFLDPACKTGVFLREIAKRLIVGLADQIPDLQERLDHIFKEQLYGIAITELTALASRRSLYCSKYANGKYAVSKFDNPDGNIRFMPINHTWEGGRCKYCGASKEQYQRDGGLETHAYEFIHTNNPEEIFNMKFDVIIGNPPYQLTTGGSSAQAVPLYNKFINNAKRLRPHYLSMIVPGRWYAGGMGLNDFRNEMLNDSHIKRLVDYQNAGDCFHGVTIRGGVCYFLRDSSYDGDCEVGNFSDGNVNNVKRRLNEYDVFVRNNKSIEILRKILRANEKSLERIVSQVSPFGLPSSIRGDKHKTEERFVKIRSSEGTGYIELNNELKNNKYTNAFKVLISRPVSGNMEVPPIKVIALLELLKPYEVCTHTYLVAGCFRNEEEAINLRSYLQTKFVRFLLSLSISGMDISREKFRYVPMQDFSKAWSDEELYEKYQLSEDEVEHIEHSISSMGSK